jgi:hypothetical protein
MSETIVANVNESVAKPLPAASGNAQPVGEKERIVSIAMC